MGDEERIAFLTENYARLVDLLGFKFTPDASLARELLEAEVMLEKKYGAPFCPCQARGKTRAENVRVICPCIPYHRKHYDAMKRCWCGLFVHKDVTDPDSLVQIDPSELQL